LVWFGLVSWKVDFDLFIFWFFGAERTSEFPGNDASILFADGVRRDKASLCLCCPWFSFPCDSVFLFHWLCYWRSQKPS
jgi:hypothetical protein